LVEDYTPVLLEILEEIRKLITVLDRIADAVEEEVAKEETNGSS